MKEIIAIIRPKMAAATKKGLDKIGFPNITAVPVLGRGKQKGIACEINIEFRPGILEQSKSSGMKYIPKRWFTIVVPDSDVDKVVEKIVEVNQTGQVGDGKIIVCPVDNAIRVRTGEEHDEAIL